MYDAPLLLPEVTAGDLVAEKTATAPITTLVDDHRKWPTQIQSQLLRLHPYLSDYDTEIVLDRVEPEAGAALGYVQVRNMTRSRPQDGVNRPGNILRVPVIAANRKLQPFLVFEAGGETYPLNEHRVGQALLNPSPFDTDTSKSPGTQSITGDLFPPHQQRNGFGRVVSAGSMGLKTASVWGAVKPEDEMWNDLLTRKEKERLLTRYLRAKAQEDPTSVLKGTATGALIGASTGAALGSLAPLGTGVRGKELLMTAGLTTMGSGALGGSLGGLTAYMDAREIRNAKKVLRDKELLKAYLAKETDPMGVATGRFKGASLRDRVAPTRSFGAGSNPALNEAKKTKVHRVRGKEAVASVRRFLY